MLVILDKLPSLWFGIPVVIAAVFLMDVLPLDYNAYGLLLVLIFRYARSYWLVLAHFVLNGFYLFYSGWLVQMVSIVPTLFIALTPGVWGFLEKNAFRAGYGGPLSGTFSGARLGEDSDFPELGNYRMAEFVNFIAGYQMMAYPMQILPHFELMDRSQK